MPIPLSPQPDKKALFFGSRFPGVFIKLEVVKTLVQNFFLNTAKIDKNGAFQKMKPDTDAYTVWFTKTEIDALFKANIPTSDGPEKYGLRIYFCQHGLTQVELDQVGRVLGTIQPGQFGGYDSLNGHHGVVLVVTQKDVNGDDKDMLDDNNAVSLSAKYLTGLDVGQPCPPPAVCAGVKVIPV